MTGESPVAVGGMRRWSADLTGATDFVLPSFAGMSHATSAVLSDVGGAWHLVPFGPFAGEPNQFVVASYGEVQGRYFVTSTNDCQPDCASTKSFTSQKWSYDASARAFERAGSQYNSLPTSAP